MANKSLQLYDKKTIAQPDRRFWGVQSNYGSANFWLYSIGLFDLQTFRSIEIKGADPARGYVGRGTPHFQFPTPPKQYEVVEPAATTITPTQDGGKFVESQGSLIKDIRIAGTVGLRPHPRSQTNLLPEGVTKHTGISLSQPTFLQQLDARGLNPTEITGFDDITFLRNIFRGYWDFKRSNVWAQRVVMIWIAAKESEWYIVEPTNFTSTRDSSSPMGWSYNIQLRTLYRFDARFRLPDPDPLSGLDKLANVWSKFRQFTRDVTKAIIQITDAVEWIAQLPMNIVSNVLSEASALISVGAIIRSAGKQLSDLYSVDRLIALKDNAFSMAGFAADLVQQRTTGSGAPAPWSSGVASPRIASNFGVPVIPDAAAADIHLQQVVHGSRLLARAVEGIVSLDGLFAQSKQKRIVDYAKSYQDADTGEPPYSAGSPLDLNNVVLPSTGDQAKVQRGDTIRSFTKRELGDEALWKLVAVLNGFKAPYISSTGGSKVAAWGDDILIPQRPEETDESNVKEGLNTDEALEALPTAEKNYGRDLKLDTTFETLETDVAGADLEVGQRGDLATVEGVPNVQQAYLIKFATEQGELAVHPNFGAAFPIGTKINLTRMQEYAVNTRRTLLQDNRTDEILRMNTYTVGGDQILVSAAVKLVKTQAELPVNFIVRTS
jgi:hypothetical protein